MFFPGSAHPGRWFASAGRPFAAARQACHPRVSSTLGRTKVGFDCQFLFQGCHRILAVV